MFLSVKAQRNQRFKHRERLPLKDMYLKFYENKGLDENCFCKTMNRIADAVEVDVGLLRPTDRFTVELAPLHTWLSFLDDSWLSVLTLASLLSNETGHDIKLTKDTTIDDFIVASCQSPPAHRDA